MRARIIQRHLPMLLGGLLLASSVLKAWAVTRSPEPPHDFWLHNPAIAAFILVAEALAGLVLVSGFWRRPAWYAAVSLFSLFAIITVAETAKDMDSCGCFGTVQVRPVYTMSVDLIAVAALLATGRPNADRQNVDSRKQNESERGDGVSEVGSWTVREMVAGLLAVVWVFGVATMWLTRPATAMAAGQYFGKVGELVVLEPEQWSGQRFSLAEHIDSGSQLASGRWIVLLVHDDCDHCAAAVPRYVEEMQKSEGKMQNGNTMARLAVIEMPPIGDPIDTPPWQLPSAVLSSHLDQSRDWFATTPVAILVNDGIVISAKEGAPAEIPDLSWLKR